MIIRSPEFNEFKSKEFRGDALLKFIVGDIFIRKFPDFTTGSHIPKMEAFVKNKTLTKVAIKLGIQPFPEDLAERQASEYAKDDRKAYANAVEAHIYDLYATIGIQAAYDFIEEHLFTAEAVKLVLAYFANENK